MTALAETIRSERAPAPFACNLSPESTDRLVRVLRTEFLELPGLTLTLPQAARVLGTNIPCSERLVKRLLDERFLVRDARGRLRRRDVSGVVRQTATWARVLVEARDCH